MVRNILLFSGTSHPQLTESICTQLGIPSGKVHLSKFSVGETRVEIGESVRGKDVFIVQSSCSTKGSGASPGSSLNDGLMELLITISACKTASAKRVTAVLPLFPYSRQSDLPYNKVGAPLARMPARTEEGGRYTFDSTPGTPPPSTPSSNQYAKDDKMEKRMNGFKLNSESSVPRRKDTLDSVQSEASYTSVPGSHNNGYSEGHTHTSGPHSQNSTLSPFNAGTSMPPEFRPQRGYRQWVAQAGTLVADLLTCAGADHIITMDLHDPQYQGFFDIPVDNLYGRHLLKRYIAHEILPHNGGVEKCVIVSPDAGGAKRATSIADALGMEFALIHKERRNPAHTGSQSNGQHPNSTLLLVGEVSGKTCILVDDLADTSNTITRAAKLLKKEGATRVYALVTHGVLSGDGVERIFYSGLDKVIVTNSVPQDEHVRRMEELAAAAGKPGGKLEVLEIAGVFAEAIRRVHHGESISVLFQYD